MNIIQPQKKNAILPFATKLMDSDGKMLSEISQEQKDKYHMFSPIYRS
jgi:hypothetical protein